MKNLIATAILMMSFQANAMYADKNVPLYSCKMVQPVADNTVSLLLTRSPLTGILVLNVSESLFAGGFKKSHILKQQIAVSTEAHYTSEKVGLVIHLTESNPDGSLPAIYTDLQGAVVEMKCSPVRMVLKI